MRFVHPELLWLLLALPLLGLGGVWLASRRKNALRRYAGGAEFVSRFTGEVGPNRRAIRLILVYVALAGVCVAAARPQWGSRLEEVQRRGVDVVLLLDTSLSMAAEDLPPSRLGHAVHAVDALLGRIEGNRVALVTFAGQPTLLCPLTLDHAAVRLFLEAMEPESSQVPGTALAGALRLAVRTFGVNQPAEQRSRALVLFSDGEDHEGRLEDAVEDLRNAGVAVYAVGCGTSRGAPIPLRDAAGLSAGYKKDREDKVVTTRLEENALESLALETGGRYDRATPDDREVAAIAEALSGMDAREYGAVLRARYEDRFQIPLAVALAALLAECLIGDRRRSRRARAAVGVQAEGRG